MPSREDVDVVEFLGLRFAQMDQESALGWIMEKSRLAVFSYLVTPNVDHLVRLHRDPPNPDRELLWRVYFGADLILCDSRILALLARWSGLDMSVSAGSDLTASLLSSPLPEGTRIALVGGTEAQRNWLAGAQPEAIIHQHIPPMGLRTNQAAQIAAAEFVEGAEPHITLLTVGAPQSEIVAQLIKSRGKARGVALCVGASLEFLTAEKRRAPRAVQALRLEWAFRLLSEPRRLWRRYLIEGAAILGIWWRWRRGKGV